MLYIYSTTSTNRFDYVCEFIFKNIIICDYEIVIADNIESNFKTIHINYSNQYIENSIQIIPEKLLFEKNINNKILSELKTGFWETDLPYISLSDKTKNEIPFDLFASVFFLITRYEEYLKFKPDKHGRFQSTESIAHKYNFLHRPLVDEWCLKFKQIIIKHFQSITFKSRKYKYLPSFDIDSIYAYKFKGVKRTVGGFIRDLKNRDVKQLGKRLNVLLLNEKDPFDNFDYIHQIMQKYELLPIFFFQVSEYGKFDKNINPSRVAVVKKIQHIHKNFEIGIHPGYASNTNEKILKKEIKILQNIIKQNVVKSRQHYLILNFPDSYQKLISIGIKKDYSLGYSDKIGFRASTCTPLYFFNLKNDTKTDLKLFPFQIMDVSLKNYMTLTPQKAITESKKIISKIQKVNGLFVSLWHNESLSQYLGWENWLSVFEQMTKYALFLDSNKS